MLWAMRPLGTLIRKEPLKPQMWPGNTAAAYRIFYQGLAYHGGRRLVTGSAFIPLGDPPADGWPVVAFAHGTTGLGDSAAPSRAGLSKLERVHVGDWLGAGYAVAATDYEGLATPGPHPYFNGEAVADDVIDSVRATRQLGYALSPKWIVAGFSQGGHAAMFTAIVATAYAPELDFRGALAFGPPVSLRNLIRHVTNTGSEPLSPLTPVILAGLRVSNPEFRPEEFLTQEGMRLLEQAERASLRDMFRATAGLNNHQAGTTEAGHRQEVDEVVSKVDVPVTKLDRPVFLSGGGLDEYYPAAFLTPFASSLRDAGTEVDYVVCEQSNHVGVLEAALPSAIAWAGEVMQHKAPAPAAPSRADARFALLDATGDGYLCRGDYQAFALRLVQALGEPVGSPRAKAVRDGYLKLWHAISAADTNHDRQVSEAEFLEWIGEADFSGQIEPLARAVIDLVDADGSGSLDPAEMGRLLTACKVPAAEIDTVVSALDSDGSGDITVDEIVASVAAFCRGSSATGYWLFGRI
jgi:predicted esterase